MSMKKRKLKDNQKQKKLVQQQNIYKCGVPKTAIFFGFQYITKKKHRNFDYLISNTSNPAKNFKIIMDKIQSISQYSWEQLGMLRKEQGYERIAYSEFKESIIDNLPLEKNISDDTKLCVFRAGKDFRIIGYKSKSCVAAIHILGFDFDFTLYDHG